MPPASSRELWGWTTPARGLLALGAIAGAIGLFLVAPGPVGRPPTAPRLVVDPNTAPPPVLGALPKLGPTLVGRIVAARGKAPFRSLDDLDARVRGIGPATVEALRPHLRTGPATPRDDGATSTSPRVAHHAR